MGSRTEEPPTEDAEWLIFDWPAWLASVGGLTSTHAGNLKTAHSRPASRPPVRRFAGTSALAKQRELLNELPNY